MIEIYCVGGFNEVGKNCVAVKVDDEVVIFDMGLQMDKYIRYTEEERETEIIDLSSKKLTELGIVPDLNTIQPWLSKVVAIVPTHAHLDHMGALPFLADKCQSKVFCTPYTKAVIDIINSDNNFHMETPILAIEQNKPYAISERLSIELVNVTHSVPQSAIAVLHTPYGQIVYTNDFKLDDEPVLGKVTNYARLEALGNQGKVRCLLLDSINAEHDEQTPSEATARAMLKEVLLEDEKSDRNKVIMVTTFSSHIARLKTIMEFGRKLHREVVFIGRSLRRYIAAAEQIGLVQFQQESRVLSFKNKIQKMFKKIEKDKGKYLVICTGHQGEPQSVLSKIVDGIYKFRFEKGDKIIFSCRTIPAPVNIKNREVLEKKLKKTKAVIIKDIHVSGHGSKHDQKRLIELLRPHYIIPSHAPEKMVKPVEALGREMGYKPEQVRLMKDGKSLVIE